MGSDPSAQNQPELPFAGNAREDAERILDEIEQIFAEDGIGSDDTVPTAPVTVAAGRSRRASRRRRFLSGKNK